MANWNDLISLFSESQQSVINRLRVKVENDFDYSTFEEFETDFSQDVNVTVNYFNELDSNDDFVLELSSWIGAQAENSSDWDEFASLFNSNEDSYVSLIIGAYEGTSVQDLAEESNETRASTIAEIENFWLKYRDSLLNYLQDFTNLLEITAQPSNQNVCYGVDISFNVTADGEDESGNEVTLTYQWRKDGQNLDSGTSAQLSINNVTVNDEGSYDCVVSTPSGLSRTTSAATLSVKESIDILDQPTSKEIEWNSNHQLLVNASGEEPLNYQWRKNGKALEGENQNELTLTNVSTKDDGVYDCVVSNVCEEVVSTKANITVVSFSSEVFLVYGKVVSEKEVPQSNITVKVLDKKPGASKELGTTVTDSKGTYQIEYLQSDLYNQEEGIPNLIVQLIADGETEPKVTSDLVEKASVKEEVNFTTNAFLDSSTEFSQIDTYLSNALEPEVNLSELEQDDIKLLVTKAFDQESIQAYINAANLNAEIAAVSQENFYGLLKQGMPAKGSEIATKKEADLIKALLSASESRIISQLDESSAQTIATNINDEAATLVEQSDSNPFKSALDNTTLSTAQKTTIVEAYVNDPTGSSDLWTTLRNASNNLSNSEIDEVQRVISIQEIDSTNNELLSVLDAKVGETDEVTNLEDLAGFDTTKWETFIDDNDEELLSIPLRFQGSEAERKTAYANELKASVEQKIPTKVLTTKMIADESFNSTDVEEFLTQYPNFKFEGEQVAKFLNENPLSGTYTNTYETVQETLEATQRLFHIVPNVDRFETIKPLMENDLTSATKIALMGEESFVSEYKASLGEETARDIFNESAKTYGRVLDVMVTNTNSVTPLVIGNQTITNEDEIVGIPNLEELFGSADFCECTHCRSVYSPAAYLVDLLNFIDDKVPDSDPEINLKNRLLKDEAELKGRRGEITKLKLNCKNTNTPLPYIDIVNEILENYIQGNLTFSYQTTEGAETLKATPQNVIESVYDNELKSATFPYHLPFNLWFEQSRAYLNQRGVNLGELINSAPIDGLSDQRKRNISAAASLGISNDQFKLISGIVPLNLISAYNTTQLSEVINPIGTFLKVAGVSYDEFTLLLGSKYVNPDEKMVYHTEENPCDLDAMTLGENDSNPDPDPVIGFSSEELMRFNRFMRLWKILKWEAKDIDILINTVGKNLDEPNEPEEVPNRLSEDFIYELSVVAQLKSRFSLEVEDMSIWWSDFDISTYIDEAIFNKVFRDKAVNYEEGDIPPIAGIATFEDEDRSLNDADIKPLVLGALNISAVELDQAILAGDINSDATAENFSYLYRLSTFSKALGISFKEYFSIRDTIEVEAVKSNADVYPSDTQEFLNKYESISNSNLSQEETNYLKSGSVNHPLALKFEDIQEFLKQLRDEYQALKINFSFVVVDLDAETNNLVDNLLSDRGTLDEIIEGTVEPDADANVENYLDENLVDSKILLPDELATFKTEIKNVKGQVESKVDERKRVVYKYFKRFNHVNSDFKAATVEKLALFYDLSTDLTAELLNLDSSLPNISFGQLIFDLNFLMNHDPINNDQYEAIFRSIRIGAKTATLAKALNTSSNELNYLVNNLPASYLALSDLPVEGDNKVDFSEIHTYLRYRELDETVFKYEITALEYFEQQTTQNRISLLAEATNWRETDLNQLVGADGFNLEATPTVYEELEWLESLGQLFPHLLKAKIDATTLSGLNLTEPDADTAFTYRNLLSSGMSKSQWQEVATKTHNKIRTQKRDAMVQYLIATDEKFSSTTDIYDYFLIDTQMSPCQLTSRIKQANSAIQLFVQRIGLGLEPDLSMHVNKEEEWNWRKNYRVWEANRKVFLYPENYILPEARANQSNLYRDFDEALAAEEIDAEVAEKAFQHYLEEFKDIANLEVAQLVNDEDTDTLHVFAKTRNEPTEYYHRSLKSRAVWSGWEKVPVDIEGAIFPVIHKGALIVCWVDIKEKKKDPGTITMDASNSSSLSNPDAPSSEFELKICWTIKKSNGWESKKISEKPIIDTHPNWWISYKPKIIPTWNHANELNLLISVGDSSSITGHFKYSLGRFELGKVEDEIFDSSLIDLPIWNGLTSFNGFSLRKYDPTPWIRKYMSIRNTSNVLGTTNSLASNNIFSARLIDHYLDLQTPPQPFLNEHRIKLESLSKFNWVDKLDFVYIPPSSGSMPMLDLLLNFHFRYRSKKILTDLNNVNAEIISELEYQFPLLSKKSFYVEEKNNTPFFISLDGRLFFVDITILTNDLHSQQGSSLNNSASIEEITNYSFSSFHAYTAG